MCIRVIEVKTNKGKIRGLYKGEPKELITDLVIICDSVSKSISENYKIKKSLVDEDIKKVIINNLGSV